MWSRAWAELPLQVQTFRRPGKGKGSKTNLGLWDGQVICSGVQ